MTTEKIEIHKPRRTGAIPKGKIIVWNNETKKHDLKDEGEATQDEKVYWAQYQKEGKKKAKKKTSKTTTREPKISPSDTADYLVKSGPKGITAMLEAIAVVTEKEKGNELFKEIARQCRNTRKIRQEAHLKKTDADIAATESELAKLRKKRERLAKQNQGK